jgi:hypothetical protein
MPVVFNPRQGGFQSVAPKNKIEEAIDKYQEDKTLPQLPQRNSGGGSSSRRRGEQRQAEERKNQLEKQQRQLKLQEERQKAEQLRQAELQRLALEQARVQTLEQQRQIAILNQRNQDYYQVQPKKSSGAELQPYKSSDYLNENRVQSGGFFGWVGKMLGLGKETKVYQKTGETGTIIKGEYDPIYIKSDKEQAKEMITINPELSPTKREFEKRLGERIGKEVEAELKAKYEQKLSNELDRVRNQLQDKVNRGGLNVELANKMLKEINDEQYNKINKEYETEFNKKIDEKFNSPDYKRQMAIKENFDTKVARSYGRDAGEELKKVANVAVDVGVGLLAQEVGAVYFTAKGASDISKGAKKDIIIAETDKQGNIFVPQYPTVKKSEETKRGTQYLTFGAISSATIPSALVRRAGTEQLRELSKQRFSISGEELLKTEQGSLLRVRAERSIGSAKQEVEFLSPQFKISKGGKIGKTESGQEVVLEKGEEFTSFFITKGKSRVKAVNPLDQNRILDTTQTFGGGGRAFPTKNIKIGTSREGTKVTKELADFQGTFGGGYLEFDKSGKLKPFKFIGGAKEEGDVIKLISGEPTRKRLTESTISLRGEVKATGEIRKIPKQQDITFVSGTGVKDTGTSLLQGAKEETIISNVVEQVGKEQSLFQPAKETFKVTTKPPKSIIGTSKQSTVQEESILSRPTTSQLTTSTSIFEDTIQKPKDTGASGITSGGGLLTRTKETQITTPLLDQPISQIERQKVTNNLIPNFKTPTPVQPRPVPDGIFGLPNLGKVEVGGGQRRQPDRGGLFGKAKYNPSLGSVLTGKKRKVTQKEAESLAEGKYIGLELRPMIEIEDKKTKRTKSKKKDSLGIF